MFEAFKIGVRLSLVNGVSHGLLNMARDFGRAEHAAESLRNTISRMSTSTKLMFGGGLAVGIGAAMAMSLKPAIDAAKEWETAKAKFGLFGMTDGQNNEAFKFAQGMNIAGSTYAENLTKMTEAQGAFREANLSGSAALDGAKLAAPMLARLSLIAKSQGHEMSEAQDKDLIRAIEMSGGLKDAKTFNARADLLYKIVGSSGGNVGYGDMRQFYARGGVAAQSLTDTALKMLEPVLGEMKGATAGVSLATAFGRLNGIVKLPNQIDHALVDAGIWDNKKIVWNAHGGIEKVLGDGNPMKAENAALLATNPVDFYRQTIAPMYAKMGLTTPAQQAVWNGKLFGRTGGTFFNLIGKQAGVIDKSAGAIDQYTGIDGSSDKMNKTTEAREQQAAANWHNLLTNIGTAILPNVNAGLTVFAGYLQKAADFTRDHTSLVKAGAMMFAISAGILIVGGAIAILAGAIAFIGAPIMAGVLLVTGAIGFIGVAVANLRKYEPQIKAFWDGIGNGISTFLSWVGDIWKHRPSWMGGDGAVNPIPVPGKNGATQADADYYAALHNNDSKSIKPRGQTMIFNADIDLGDGVTKRVTQVLGKAVKGAGYAMGSGSFDSGLTQPTPGQHQ